MPKISTGSTTLFAAYSLSHRRVVGWLPTDSTISWSQVGLAKIIESYRQACGHLTEQWLLLPDFPLDQAVDTIHHLESVLNQYQIQRQQVVLVIQDHLKIEDDAAFATVAQLKQQGFLLAFAQVGLGTMNPSLVMELRPHFVLLQEAIFTRSRVQKPIRAYFQKLVQFLHEMGAFVIGCGVSSSEDVQSAINAGCDMIVSQFVGVHSVDQALNAKEMTLKIDQCWEAYLARSFMQRKLNHRQFELARQAFVQTAISLVQNVPFIDAVKPMWVMPDVIRCYLLDSNGRQVGNNVNMESRLHHHAGAFAPFDDQSGAIWSRRAYFQHAVEQPGVLHMTEPYLSLADARSCITLSLAIDIDEVQHVLCADISRPN